MRQSTKIGLLFSSLLFAVLGIGCGGGDEGGGTTVEGETGGAVVAQPHLLLDGSQAMVFNLNLSKMRKISIYDKLREFLLDEPGRKAFWDDLNENMGLDPIEDFESVVIGLGQPYELDNPIANSIVVMSAQAGTFKDQEAMVKGWLGFLDGRYMDGVPNPSTDTYNGYKTWSVMRVPMVDQPDKSMDMHVSFLNDATMLAGSTLENLHKTLDVAKGVKPNIAQHVDWTENLKMADFSAVLWGVGVIPEPLQNRISEIVQTTPGLKDLVFLNRGEDFELSFNYTGGEYTLKGSLGTDEVRYAGGIKDQLLVAIERDVPTKMLQERMPDNLDRVAVLGEMFKKLLISTQGSRATAMFRMQKEEFHGFVERVMHPPASGATSAETPAPVNDPFANN